jgi:hypothetical protein
VACSGIAFLGVDGRVILIWILEEAGSVDWVDVAQAKPLARSCEHGNGT